MLHMASVESELPFRIEVWDDADSRVEELIALVGDYATANRVYDRKTGYAPPKGSLGEVGEAARSRPKHTKRKPSEFSSL